MSLLVDTGVLYAHHDSRTDRHEDGRAAVRTIATGTHGQPYVSDYVFDEAVTLTRSRTGSHGAARGMCDRMLGNDPFPDLYRMLHVTESVFEEAVEAFERFDDQPLSFTDATTVALVEHHDHVVAGLDAGAPVDQRLGVLSDSFVHVGGWQGGRKTPTVSGRGPSRVRPEWVPPSGECAPAGERRPTRTHSSRSRT